MPVYRETNGVSVTGHNEVGMAKVITRNQISK